MVVSNLQYFSTHRWSPPNHYVALHVRYASVVELPFLIKLLYLIGMWFGEDQIANTIKTRV